MADEAKSTLAKMKTLQAALVEVQEKARAIVEEMGNLLGGGPGIGEQLKRFQAHYSECWHVRYRSAYSFTFAKDVPQMKRLIKQLGIEELERRALNYCRDGEAYLVKARHPFALFVARVNSYADPGTSVAGDLDLELDDEAAQTRALLNRPTGARK